MKIRLHYHNHWQNFGDELSIYIARKLSNNVKYSDRLWCNAVFIGSLLDRFMARKTSRFRRALLLLHPHVFVWGAGYLSPPSKKEKVLFRRLDVRACRGVLTLNRLKNEASAKIADDVVLADPGLLASHFIDTSHNKKKYALGIITHRVDMRHSLLSKIVVKNAINIDIQQSPEAFMKQLSECENIISSAMHGLIAADSLGIPNMRMALSGELPGGDYKFDDYYSAFGFNSHPIINLKTQTFTDDDLPSIKESYIIKPEQIKQLQERLLTVFPFK